MAGHSQRAVAGIALAAWTVIAGATPVRGQGFESLGTRAQGMGGAFVAVADDVTAVYWNPAGLAHGALFSAVADWQHAESGRPDLASPPFGMRGSGVLIGLGAPPVGVAYYHLSSSTMVDGTAQRLVTDNVGVSLVQSLATGLAVGGTVRFVHAGVAVAPAPAGTTVDEVDELDGAGFNTVDVDFGFSLVLGRLRAGLAARNLLAPSFRTAAQAQVTVERQVRAGAAWVLTDRVTLALDADLTATGAQGHDRRNLAVGVETWWGARRVAVRSGLRGNTAGAADVVAAIGGSVKIWRAWWIDAQLSGGRRPADRSWGLAADLRF